MDEQYRYRRCKVDIYRAGQTIKETLKRYYFDFGKIINIRILDKHLSSVGFGYALIEFSNDYVANAIIFHRSEYDIRFEVYAFEPTMEHLQNVLLEYDDTDFFILPRRQISSSARKMQSVVKVSDEQPPDPDSPSNILNALNDDCLQQIFERVPIEDLCSVADTCEKFRTNVQRICSLQFNKFTPATNNLYQLESLLRNFGNKIKSLSICRRSIESIQNNLLLLTLATYCSNANCQIETLSIEFDKFLPIYYTILRPIIARLKQLHIGTVNFDIHSLNESKMLTALSIETENCSCRTLYTILLKFPNLHQLGLCSVDITNGLITADRMKHRLENMKCLKELKLNSRVAQYLYDSKNIFELLADAGVKIECLILILNWNGSNREILSIQRLKYIQILEVHHTQNPNWNRIYADAETLLEVVENLPNLSEFELHLGELRLSIIDIKRLAKCDTLTVLRLFDPYDRIDPVDDNNFDELLRLVSRRKSKKKLTIQIQSRYWRNDLLQVAQKKLNAHLQILEIKDLRRTS